MQQLDEGVYALENHERYDLDWSDVLLVLELYGDGIERTIAQVIFTCCHQFGRWVGVSATRLLKHLVWLEAQKNKVEEHDRQAFDLLTIQIGRTMMAAINRGRLLPEPWIREVHVPTVGRSDTILALNVRRVTSPSPDDSEN